jgi:CTP-dependent riboflavin kinase
MISGRLAAGVGLGKHFTQLDWARQQFMDKLGIEAYPGTANIVALPGADSAAWQALKTGNGIRIVSPGNGPRDCDARCYPVSIQGRLTAAIVLPEVEGYAGDLMEVISEFNVRDTLGIADGDIVRLLIR